MPYALMVRRLRTKLEREKDPDKREELEIIVTVLLAMIEIQETIAKLITELEQKAP